MLNNTNTQIYNTKFNTNYGKNPIVMIGSVFYTNHKALLNEKNGEINKKLVEQEINDFITVIDETGIQAAIDVIGSYSDALIKNCEYIASIADCPFLVDGVNDSIRIPAMEGLKELGLLDRAILNSIDDNTSEENIRKLKEIGIKNAVLLTFSNKALFPNQKLKLLKEKLLPYAQKANVENIIIDTAVLDLPSIGLSTNTIKLIKEEYNFPVGLAPSNAIYNWEFIKNYDDFAGYGAIASIMTYCVPAGSDFILFGPVKFAKNIVPSIAMISGINSYYRKRILKESISEINPIKLIF